MYGRSLELRGESERWKFCQLSFTDDTALVANSEVTPRDERVGRRFDQSEMRMNILRKKDMKCIEEELPKNGSGIEMWNIRESENFNYLGVIIKVNGEVALDMSIKEWRS